jgi:hypothetical protein
VMARNENDPARQGHSGQGPTPKGGQKPVYPQAGIAGSVGIAIKGERDSDRAAPSCDRFRKIEYSLAKGVILLQ